MGGGLDVGGGATGRALTSLGSYQWLTVAPGGGGGACARFGQSLGAECESVRVGLCVQYALLTAAAATVRMPDASLASHGRKRAYIFSFGLTPLETRMQRLSR